MQQTVFEPAAALSFFQRERGLSNPSEISEMTAEEIFAEILCDSVAEINAFGEYNTGDIEAFMSKLQYTAEENARENRETRGPPADAETSFSRVNRKANRARKTYNTDKNANGTFSVSELVDLADENDIYWTGRELCLVYSMNEQELTEFQKEFHRLTKDMDEYGENPAATAVEAYFDVSNGKKTFRYFVIADGYMHGEVYAKCDLSRNNDSWNQNIREEGSNDVNANGKRVRTDAGKIAGERGRLRHDRNDSSGRGTENAGVHGVAEGESGRNTSGTAARTGSGTERVSDNTSQEAVDKTAKFSRKSPTVAAIEESENLLKQQLEYWLGKPKMGNGKFADPKDVRRVTRVIVEEYRSKANRAEISKDMQEIADVIAREGAEAVRKKNSANWTEYNALYGKIRPKAEAIARKPIPGVFP